MGHKTRSNYKLGACLKECSNRGEQCEDCIRFSEYIPERSADENGKHENIQK